MRLGFFGGTFDPPHNGHLAVARAAADFCKLDRVLIAPTGRQPLKSNPSTASFVDRLAMVKLLAHEDSRFIASDLDAPRNDGQPNFTVDTLRRLRASSEPGDIFFNIVGIDAFADLPRWRAPTELLTITDWVVVSRPGLDVASIVDEVVPRERRSHIHVIDSVHEAVSATSLRKRLRDGLSCASLLPEAIRHYIDAHELYR